MDKNKIYDKGWIYFIINIINGHIYIGSTVQKRIRWYRHRTELNKGNHHCLHLQRAWKKYGKENFQFCIVFEAKNIKITELLNIEQFYLDSFKPEYNMSHSTSYLKSYEFKNKTIFGEYVLQDFDGNEIYTNNLSKTCDDLGLSYKAVINVLMGDVGESQGYKVRYKNGEFLFKNKKIRNKYKIILPNNTIVIVENLVKYCKANHLSYKTLHAVAKGKKKSYKKYKCEIIGQYIKNE